MKMIGDKELSSISIKAEISESNECCVWGREINAEKEDDLCHNKWNTYWMYTMCFQLTQ